MFTIIECINNAKAYKTRKILNKRTETKGLKEVCTWDKFSVQCPHTCKYTYVQKHCLILVWLSVLRNRNRVKRKGGPILPIVGEARF